jgi:hypothetical protein
MMILDNATRWNSTYLMVNRALELQGPIDTFSHEFRKDLGIDLLSDEDWEVIKDIHHALRPFWELTLVLQSKNENGHHGYIWEWLPSLDLLLKHMEELDKWLKTRTSRNTLVLATDEAWKILRKYYNLTDNCHHIYGMATLLNPTMGPQYFKDKWKGLTQANLQIQLLLDHCKAWWEHEYPQRNPLSDDEEEPLIPQVKQNILEKFCFGDFNKSIVPPNGRRTDDFQQYLKQTRPTTFKAKEADIATWWTESRYPTLRQLAYDTVSCPAMSAECERVFSAAGQMLTPSRNALHSDVIEACQCLKYWWDQGFVTMKEYK